MDITRNPELLDRLAAAHALGTLRGGARRRFEHVARQSPTARAAALLWQERFAALTELQPARVPSANVWKRIENLLAAQRSTPGAAEATARLERARRWWRGFALAAALAGVAAFAVAFHLSGEVAGRDARLAQLDTVRANLASRNAQLTAQLQGRPEIQYVAVLADDRAGASMLVTFDPARSTLTIKRVGGYREASDKSLQLWALPARGGPQSLGVLGASPIVKLTAADTQVREVPALAISLEPKGGVPSARGPTGPVLFKGALLRTS